MTTASDTETEDDEFGDDVRYPTDTELRMIREFSGTPAEMVEFLDRHWWSADWGLHVTGGDEFAPHEGDFTDVDDFRWVHLSTGGWSGNEDRLSALRHSGRMMDFWNRYWHTSRVGGHYLFRVPAAQWDVGIDSFELPKRPKPIEDIVTDAVALVIEHGDDYAYEPENYYLIFGQAKEDSEVRAWTQTFGSTTGPFSGVGGSAMTSFRVTAVRVDSTVVWHLGDQVAFITEVDGTETPALRGWLDGRMPMHRDVVASTPSWCPSTRRRQS